MWIVIYSLFEMLKYQAFIDAMHMYFVLKGFSFLASFHLVIQYMYFITSYMKCLHFSNQSPNTEGL